MFITFYGFIFVKTYFKIFECLIKNKNFKIKVKIFDNFITYNYRMNLKIIV